MKHLTLLALLVLAPAFRAQDKAEVLWIRVTNLWTGAEAQGGPDAKVILVRDGKIAKIGTTASVPVPAGARIIDEAGNSGSWALPGLVLANAPLLSRLRDGAESVTPAVRAADAFDPFSPRQAWLREGVCVAYLAPGRLRLVSGQGAVVRLGSADPMEAFLNGRAALQACLAEEGWSPPAVYDAPVPPGPDNPLPAARRQFPSSRGGAVLALRRCFECAAATGRSSELMAQLRKDLHLGRQALSLVPFEGVLAKRMPLRVYAQRAADISAAIELAQSLGLRLVIEGGREAWRVADELAEMKAAVVLEAGDRLGGTLPPPAPYAAGVRGRAHPDALSILREAGVAVALIPPSGGSLEDLLFYASKAEGSMPKAAVLEALTAAAARILGVQDRAGTLAEGRVADLVLFDRHPLDPGAHPQLVIAGGRVVHRARSPQGELVAIHGQRIHLGDGKVVEDRWVIVQGKKIVAVCGDDGVPPGARIVRGDTITPGFIDLGGQIGFRAYKDSGTQGGVQLGDKLGRLKMSQKPVESFDPEFEDVAAAARSGVTCVALTPTGGRLSSGVLSVVKACSNGGKAVVLKDLGGILMDSSGSRWSQDQADSIKNSLKSAKSYHEAWIKYEKALAAWESKNSTKKSGPAGPKKKLGKVRAPSVRDPITGTWTGTAVVSGRVIAVDGNLELHGTRVTGDFGTPMFPNRRFDVDTELVDGKHLSFSVTMDGQDVTVDLDVGRDEMSGTVTVSGVGSGPINLRRSLSITVSKSKAVDAKKGKAKAAAKSAKVATKGKPKAPRKNPNLEPWRPAFRKEIPVFFGVRSERLARAVLPFMRKDLGLRVALISSEPLPQVADLCHDLGVSVALRGSGRRRSEGEILIPLRSALWSGATCGMRSGWGGDVRSLVPSAHHAVYLGISPADAVSMLTSQAADILGIGGRVGRLRRGLDADLVIFRGDVFQGGSRIDKVMVDGRFVGEEVGR